MDNIADAYYRDLARAIDNQDNNRILLLMKKISIYTKRGLTPELTLKLAQYFCEKGKPGRKRTFYCYETFDDEAFKWSQIIYEYRKQCKQSTRGAATKIKESLCNKHGVGIKDFEKHLTFWRKKDEANRLEFLRFIGEADTSTE